MSYNGYLMKVGNYTMPLDKIRAETYNAILHVQDLDSTRNANGVLQRTALEHTVAEVNFNLCAMLTNRDVSDIFNNIRTNYINKSERKVLANLYVPELDDYITQEMYMPDTTFPMFGAYDTEIVYNEIKLSFIGY